MIGAIILVQGSEVGLFREPRNSDEEPVFSIQAVPCLVSLMQNQLEKPEEEEKLPRVSTEACP